MSAAVKDTGIKIIEELHLLASCIVETEIANYAHPLSVVDLFKTSTYKFAGNTRDCCQR